jgi:zinc/manganese transport system permease protein
MFSGFMAHAWEIGTIVAIVGGVVGFFVVLRGAAFEASVRSSDSVPSPWEPLSSSPSSAVAVAPTWSPRWRW